MQVRLKSSWIQATEEQYVADLNIFKIKVRPKES